MSVEIPMAVRRVDSCNADMTARRATDRLPKKGSWLGLDAEGAGVGLVTQLRGGLCPAVDVFRLN